MVSTECEPVHHAAERWARLIVAVSECGEDPRTVSEWARHVSVSSGTLRAWCRMAGTPPKRSLALARILRAVHVAERAGCLPQDVLDVKDPRTLEKLMRSSGLVATRGSGWQLVSTLLKNQSHVQAAEPLRALERLAWNRFHAGTHRA